MVKGKKKIDCIAHCIIFSNENIMKFDENHFTAVESVGDILVDEGVLVRYAINHAGAN